MADEMWPLSTSDSATLAESPSLQSLYSNPRASLWLGVPGTLTGQPESWLSNIMAAASSQTESEVGEGSLKVPEEGRLKKSPGVTKVGNLKYCLSAWWGRKFFMNRSWDCLISLVLSYPVVSFFCPHLVPPLHIFQGQKRFGAWKMRHCMEKTNLNNLVKMLRSQRPAQSLAQRCAITCCLTKWMETVPAFLNTHCVPIHHNSLDILLYPVK